MRSGISVGGLGSQIGRFFRDKKYSVVVSKIAICPA